MSNVLSHHIPIQKINVKLSLYTTDNLQCCIQLKQRRDRISRLAYVCDDGGDSDDGDDSDDSDDSDES